MQLKTSKKIKTSKGHVNEKDFDRVIIQVIKLLYNFNSTEISV